MFDTRSGSKGSHRYDRLYEKVIGPFREGSIHLLEIGTFEGSSIDSWLDYCPNAHVTTIDTFQRLSPEEIPVLQRRRVTWFKQDSTAGVPVGIDRHFDFIIDDGCHTHDAQRRTFQNYMPLLAKGGSYFIEDVWPFDLMSEREKAHPWLRSHPNDWTDEKYSRLLDELRPYKVTFHDLRQGYHPDSFIIEVKR